MILFNRLKTVTGFRRTRASDGARFSSAHQQHLDGFVTRTRRTLRCWRRGCRLTRSLSDSRLKDPRHSCDCIQHGAGDGHVAVTDQESGVKQICAGRPGIGIDVGVASPPMSSPKDGCTSARLIVIRYECATAVCVPYWSTILKTAMLAARVVGLKYAGVDISADKKKGPVVWNRMRARDWVPLRIRCVND